MPWLKQSTIAKYIQQARIAMDINLPSVKNRVISLHKKMVRLNENNGKRIKATVIAREVGCCVEWARIVLKDHNKQTSSKINTED